MIPIELSQRRCFFVGLETLVPDLHHLGRSNLLTARSPLARHTHEGLLELVLVNSGEFRYEIEGELFSVCGGDGIVSFPGELHSTGGLPEDKVSISWVAVRLDPNTKSFIGSDCIDMLKLKEELLALPRRHFQASPEIFHSMQGLLGIEQDTRPYLKELTRGHLIHLLAQLVFDSQHGVKKDLLSLEGALDIIHQRYFDKIELEELAQAVHMSLPHFKREFKKIVGIPPYDYLLRWRIERSRELLLQSKISVTKIAQELGFSSSQHYATMFKKYSHFTPKAYREHFKINFLEELD